MIEDTNEYDGEIVYRGEWDDESTLTPSTGVAKALEELTDASAPSLYDVVNPDSLDALFRPRHDGSPRSSGRVNFDYDGFAVTVDADGSFVIERPE
ncbi:HalOD1 output domain-containing protein [Haladaptatus sp. NG-WS-4]